MNILYDVLKDDTANPAAQAKIYNHIIPEFGFHQHKLFNVVLKELNTMTASMPREQWEALPATSELTDAIAQVRDIDDLRTVWYTLRYVRERQETLRAGDMDYVSHRFAGHYGWKN